MSGGRIFVVVCRSTTASSSTFRAWNATNSTVSRRVTKTASISSTAGMIPSHLLTRLAIRIEDIIK